MVTVNDVVCPKCREDRLIDTIRDKMGERYFCQVCAHEFRKGSELSAKTPPR